MNKEQLYEDFIKNIINHDYSYDYSDSNTVWERGRQQKDLIRQQLKELINIHKYDPILLLGDCLLARGEQAGSNRDLLPVADAKLVWVDNGKPEGHSKTPLYIDDKWLSPILISETEKIEVGDKVWDTENKEILDVPRIEIAEHFNKGISNGYYFKIIALPEHFSPKHLQAIVDGKMKDGDKVLVECEKKCAGNCLQSGVILDCAMCFNIIKLNSSNHITLHKVEEKMYTEDEFKDKLKKILWDYIRGEDDLVGTDFEGGLSVGFNSYQETNIDKWFEQNVK